MNSRTIQLNGSTINSHSSEETHAIGFRLGKTLPKGSVLCFYGDLGAGKTTLIRGIVEGINGVSAVRSPTFTYVNLYGNVHHYDLYRLEDEEAFLARGLDEPFGTDAICLIEWPERIASLLPANALTVRIAHA